MVYSLQMGRCWSWRKDEGVEESSLVQKAVAPLNQTKHQTRVEVVATAWTGRPDASCNHPHADTVRVR